jgi:hypothetical protein
MFKFVNSLSTKGIKELKLKNEISKNIYTKWMANFSKKFMDRKEKIKGYLGKEKTEYKAYLDLKKDKYIEEGKIMSSTRITVKRKENNTEGKQNNKISQTESDTESVKTKKKKNKSKIKQEYDDLKETKFNLSHNAKLDILKNHSYLFENEKILYFLKRNYGVSSHFFSKKLVNEVYL